MRALGLFVVMLALGFPVEPVRPDAKPENPTCAPRSHMIPKGTTLRVTPIAEIGRSKLKVGDEVLFRTISSPPLGDGVLRQGTLVKGTISWKSSRSFFGKRGKFDVTFSSIVIGGRDWAVSGRARATSPKNSGAIGELFVSRPPRATIQPGQVFSIALVDDIGLPGAPAPCKFGI